MRLNDLIRYIAITLIGITNVGVLTLPFFFFTVRENFFFIFVLPTIVFITGYIVWIVNRKMKKAKMYEVKSWWGYRSKHIKP